MILLFWRAIVVLSSTAIVAVNLKLITFCFSKNQVFWRFFSSLRFIAAHCCVNAMVADVAAETTSIFLAPSIWEAKISLFFLSSLSWTVKWPVHASVSRNNALVLCGNIFLRRRNWSFRRRCYLNLLSIHSFIILPNFAVNRRRWLWIYCGYL